MEKLNIMEAASRLSCVDLDDDGKFTCEICADEKNDMFKLTGCDHSYCSECIAKYICSKLQENISQISCPVSGCNGLLVPHECHSILPSKMFNKWGDLLCEAMILESEKYYCPFKDCSALLLSDETYSGHSSSVITESECPECRRLFCAKCKVAWHAGVECEEYEKMNKDEKEREGLQLLQLAKSEEWQRCPNCRMYVSRTEGCAQMKCRCGTDFCYKCGAHSSDHYCSNCGKLVR